ncbi:hypothetical protein D9V37_00490 [Nocardioides mangrovicus]|uniref:Uncharacterized protein n=2 Tax=Nocardioides mangrovicus TaxID=2478913 RepID=A0A3L8P803_9ACTN|nr:hypothetical protein D9V37_00490 [Nocardioides mangrovicus]
MFPDGARAARFASLAMRVFAEHGIECSYDDGFLRGSDGRSYGLTNVALVAAAGTDRHWRELLEQHVGGIVAAHATPRQRDLEAVGDRLYLRLWAAADLPHRPDGVNGFGEPLGEGLVGLAAIDHPEHVETLTGGHDIGLLGGWDVVRRTALANLAALRADDVVPLGDDPHSQVQLSIGGFFNASRVFTMERLLREDFLLEEPSHGVLLVVPNRHLVAVHPLRSAGMVEAVHTLTRLARAESEVPGGISPHVWFWRDGWVEQVTRSAEEPDTVELHVAGLLEVAMRELDLVEDPGDSGT